MRLHQGLLRHNSHSLTYLSVHIVFCTKYRHKIMVGDINSFVTRQIESVCNDIDVKIQKLHVDTDHVHLLCEYPPNFSIPQLVKRIKGNVSRYVRLQFPKLSDRSVHSISSFWSIGYFATSVGEDAESRIIRYISQHTDWS